MLALNKDQITKLRTLLKSEVGKSLISDFKDIIVKTDNYPANATDGMLFALLEGRREGELSVLRQLIKIGESNE
jgi:hypothetical protein